METGNNQYVITISGETFKTVQFQEVLPEAIVTSVEAGNHLAWRMLILWLRHMKSKNVQFMQLGKRHPYSLANFNFAVKERNV